MDAEWDRDRPSSGRDITNDRHVIIEDETLAQGFTQIPNGVLRRSDLQPGAKLTYMVLLSYAWQQSQAYPGQDRLARDMGVSERSVITYLKQLQETGLVTIRRRGLGLTNVYVIHRISGSENSALQARSEISAPPEVKNPTALEVQDLRPKKTQGEEDTVVENRSNRSKGLSTRVDPQEEQITWVVRDLAQELADQAPLKSTTTRVLSLYRETGLPADDFIDIMQAARVRTKRYQGNIRAEATGEGRKPKMAYFLRVLEDMTG